MICLINFSLEVYDSVVQSDYGTTETFEITRFDASRTAIQGID